MMENSDTEGIIPVSNKTIELTFKNLLDEVKWNEGDSVTFSTPPFIKDENPQKFNNDSFVKLIKEEDVDVDDVFIENKICSIIKIEPERNVFKTEHLTSNAHKNVKNTLDSLENFDKYSNLCTFEAWKLKNEELDIKEEVLEPCETRMWSNSICQKKTKDGIIKNSHEKMQKQNLKKPTISPKKPVKVLKCGLCDYQDFQKANLKRHLLQHRSPEDDEMFKCYHCDYQTVKKYNLKIHLLQHKNPEDVNMLKCDQCNYQTLHKTGFKLHYLKHKNPEDVLMFKCDQCEYQSFYKNSLKVHLLMHKNSEDINMFKCDQCDYQTFRKWDFKKHFVRHKNPEDVNMFICNQCGYQASQKNNLKRHILRHKKPEDIDMFKCDQCNYQTCRKNNLKMHLVRHKNFRHQGPKQVFI